MNSKKFKLPRAFLNNLAEFTTGYYLVTLDQDGNFEVHANYPNQSIELALINFIDIQSTMTQELLRQKAIDDNSEGDEETN